ncbi:Phosphatidylserine/phosphatidylglycerophosphate/cardiolipin synthase [Geodermatophilus obscurus]|uniref:Phosphatidylserine/phosphatidylglycerophosphate/cardiolipin synthase n=1 Tax=Geodermatophilus obscurus TaxID=1861 RepID=A0A1M7SP50_9ACTN|nr:phospholipase D family protein [Geodermatophilus obscurus]SHN60235.1 Phosphatidylserine/phosphatidylglycerophosphate/cardiolipin synthase [Geodermatophilus obscurus]
MPRSPGSRREPRWARELRGGHPWLLSSAQRGNEHAGLPAWREGNAVRALVDGRSYLPVLAEALARTGQGDAVLFTGWRAEAEELLDDGGPPLAAALVAAARRGALVRGLLWRSHPEALGYTLEANRALARAVTAAGGRVLLDQRVRPLGSHHQKSVVVTGDGGADELAFVGGIDTARSRRDGAGHRGDPQARSFARVYGPTPAWHDVQLQVRGPAVRDVETVFRQRWTDPAPPTRWPWHTVPDRLHGIDRAPGPLPPPAPPPDPAGTCTVQLLRTYPRRRPRYPFAPDGERSVARGYAKALARARRLVYVEDQYLWSRDVARIFAAALRRSPTLRLVAVVPRYVDREGGLDFPASLLGQNTAWKTVLAAGGDRVQLFDLENEAGRPVYVHAKVCVVDDVWAAVGSANLNRRSWTHDSELTAAVLDEQRDGRRPLDPGGLGDGARAFARELRLALMREHLGRTDGDDTDLLDLGEAAGTMRRAAADLDAWHDDGRRGPRPPGQVRAHPRRTGGGWLPRALVTPVYGLAYDPDGRPWSMRLRHEL